MTLITTPELRMMLDTAKMMAGFAKTGYEQILKQANQAGQILPPSECAQISLAISLNVLAACAVKELEMKEANEGQAENPRSKLLETA